MVKAADVFLALNQISEIGMAWWNNLTKSRRRELVFKGWMHSTLERSRELAGLLKNDGHKSLSFSYDLYIYFLWERSWIVWYFRIRDRHSIDGAWTVVGQYKPRQVLLSDESRTKCVGQAHRWNSEAPEEELAKVTHRWEQWPLWRPQSFEPSTQTRCITITEMNAWEYLKQYIFK